MIMLFFYRGPGNLITRMIRLLTLGPYSHVELQFSDGCRFFSDGHGICRGVHLECDEKHFGHNWDAVAIPVTADDESRVRQIAFAMQGYRFDYMGMFSFLLPGYEREREAHYCSSVVLQVLQSGLGIFKGVKPKISPNGLYRLVTQ